VLRLTKYFFTIYVVGRFYSCLVRQINEAVKIEMSEAECVMNSRHLTVKTTFRHFVNKKGEMLKCQWGNVERTVCL